MSAQGRAVRECGDQLGPRHGRGLGQAPVDHHVGAEGADPHLGQHRGDRGQLDGDRLGESWCLADAAAEDDQRRVDDGDHAADRGGDQASFARHLRSEAAQAEAAQATPAKEAAK